MEHLFDNRQFVQSIVVSGGNKASVTTSSKKYKISLEEVVAFFYNNLNDEQLAKLSIHLCSNNKNGVCKSEILLWCEDVIRNTLTHYHAHDYNSKYKMSLRDVFMERVAWNGCASAILFLKKYYYRNHNLNKAQQSSSKHNETQQGLTIAFSESA
jgi:hypothetical protein